MGLFSKIKNVFKKSAPAVQAAGTLIGGVTGHDFSFLGDAMAGIGSFAAPAIGSYLSAAQQDALLDKQFAFQERMSNTAHQREVRDLVAAGINPLYTVTGGNGASTPLGSTGSQTDFANAFSSGLGRAFERRMQRAQIRSMDYTNERQYQDGRKAMYEADYAKQQSDKYEEYFKAQVALMTAQTYAALNAGAASSAQASYMNQEAINHAISNFGDKAFMEYLKKNPDKVNLYGFNRVSPGFGVDVRGPFGIGAGFRL